MGRLTGKVAVITGGAQGIGAEFMRAFAAEGARVVSADIADSAAIVAEIEQAGGNALGLKTDVTDSASLAAMVQAAEEKFGPVEILINNAAMFAALQHKPLEQIPEHEWDEMMRINVRGLWQTTKAIVPSMRRNGRGKIINLTSGTIHKGPPGQLHYVASKGAVFAMSHSMARELAGDHITVNAICPGLTLSAGVQANANWQPFRKSVVDARAIKREMMPNDLVGAALFLATPDSDFITGQSINVDGGMHMS